MADGSFDEFARAQYASLTRYAVALTGDRHAADDLVQETLARVLGAWGRVRRDGNPVGYATATMFRTYISIWRKNRKSSGAVELPEDTPSPADAYAAVDDQDTLRRALSGLSRTQRAVLVASYLDDRDDAQIAVLIGRRPATVRSLRQRGLRALRAAMASTDGEVPDGHTRIATA